MLNVRKKDKIRMGVIRNKLPDRKNVITTIKKQYWD